MTNAIVMALAPIFFVLALGYGAGRLRVVENTNVDALNALVMDFALPAALFVVTASASRSQMFDEAPLFLVFAGMMSAVQVTWYILALKVWPTSSADASLQALTISFPNLAGVGLPIAAAVLGAHGDVPVAVALASGSIITSPVSLVLVEMSLANEGGASQPVAIQVARAFQRAITKPVVWAPALGILMSLADVTLDPAIEACLMLIGNAAAGVALFLTGLVLSSQPFKADREILAATGMANIVRPLLTAGIVFLLPISSEMAKIAILLATTPSGFFGILFAVSYRLDSATIGSIVTASTVTSVVTMAIAIAVLFPG